jgi:hypothetical protein
MIQVRGRMESEEKRKDWKRKRPVKRQAFPE